MVPIGGTVVLSEDSYGVYETLSLTIDDYHKLEFRTYWLSRTIQIEQVEAAMEFNFDCQCGGIVAEFTRGDANDITTRAACPDCGMVYAITITALGEE